ncbi:unnamed protein product [Orchesella dallaii]|uniref:Uncharacterized protein n=1 Tax=Orchesella dallaii TaxID=48710 RepID=A0ABP1R942_9HEXA
MTVFLFSPFSYVRSEFVTTILFLGSTFRAYRISSYEREENSKQLLGAMIIATYFFTLLVLGCLIFRGVEHKSPKMLGWSGGTFITLETFAFVFNLVLLSPMGGAYDEYGLRNFGFTVDVFQILLSLLFLGCMAGYCVVIILYILKLREDDTGSEYTYGEFDDAGTIPAPPVATNLSRSSTAHSTYSVHHNNKNSNPQLSQTASHGHLSQCNSQYHIGQNQISGTHKSPLLQERRLLPKVNHLSQDRLNETTPSIGSHYSQHHQRSSPYVPNTGSAYANYQRGGVPYRQTQTLPHPHHYHRQMPSIGGVGGGTAGAVSSAQFPSRSRMDLATLTQTLTRNSNLKRAVLNASTGSNMTGTTSVPTTTSTTIDSSYDCDQWEQPRVQALKYTYGIRKGGSGSNIGIEV